jgi:hypothetical protein
MAIDGGLLASQTKPFEFKDYVRIIPLVHVATPLGCAPGISRFGGTDQSFAVLYAARDLATALAETVIRDRFEGSADRRLFFEELAYRAAVQLHASAPLRLVDLREGGCLKLGVSTDIAGAKLFLEAQQFAQDVYQEPTVDGILYASRLTGQHCVAVFDRVIASYLQASDVAPLTQIQQVGAALASLNFQLTR